MSNSIEKHETKPTTEIEFIDIWGQRLLTFSGVPGMILSLYYNTQTLAIVCFVWIVIAVGYSIIKRQNNNQLIEIEFEAFDSSALVPEDRITTRYLIPEATTKKHEISSNDSEASEELFTESFEVETTTDEKAAIIENISKIVEEVEMSNGKQDYGKILVRRFLNLNEYDRDQVLKSLSLNAPPLISTGDNALNREIIQRVVDRGMLESFWDEVEKKHDDQMFPENPYKLEEKI